MHKLNFCQEQCLPTAVDGYKARGIPTIKEFKWGHTMPMFKVSTENHLLYATKPFFFLGGNIVPLGSDELKTQEDVDRHSDISHALAQDSLLDTHPDIDHVIPRIESEIKHIADKILDAGAKNVVVWANSGIGSDAYGLSDGVLRYTKGIAYGTRLENKPGLFFQKKKYKDEETGKIMTYALPDRYQNTAHAHVHIAPGNMPAGMGFGEDLYLKLAELHESSHLMAIDEARDYIRHKGGYVPAVSLTRLDKSNIDDEKIKFVHFFGPELRSDKPDISMSEFAANTIAKYHLEKSGINFRDPDVRKEQVQNTIEFYNRIL